MKNIFDKITMPVGVVYNIVAENGCKMQGKANVEKISNNDASLAVSQRPDSLKGVGF